MFYKNSNKFSGSLNFLNFSDKMKVLHWKYNIWFFRVQPESCNLQIKRIIYKDWKNLKILQKDLKDSSEIYLLGSMLYLYTDFIQSFIIPTKINIKYRINIRELSIIFQNYYY